MPDPHDHEKARRDRLLRMDLAFKQAMLRAIKHGTENPPIGMVKSLTSWEDRENK